MAQRSKDVRVSLKGNRYVPAVLREGKKWAIEYWVWDLGKDQLVRRRVYNIPGDTTRQRRTEARRIIREINELLLEGSTVGEKGNPVDAPITLMEAFRKALELKLPQVGARTQRDYKSVGEAFLDFLVNTKRAEWHKDEVSKKDIHAFLDTYTEKGLSNKTRNNALSYVRALFTVLVDREMLKENPASKIKNLKTKSSTHTPFSPAEQKKLEQYLIQHNKRLYYFTRFIYYGFLRRVEVCRLQRKHINLKTGVLVVSSGDSKNRKQQPVVIIKSWRGILEEMNIDEIPPNYYVFGSKGLKPGPSPIIPTRVTEQHKEALEACEMYEGTGHTLYGWKHSGNIAAYNAGVDLLAIMTQNRHASPMQTYEYMNSMGLQIENSLKKAEW